ncbi:DegQ family serine endoprotease [Dyella nitratireducens]|uniref:Heat-shock protein n=1 Tax=Dyella nitratireducens TaxID=1849580 RepID=A0ABQ1FRE6_9GAMM|nr:DegQ family serine endoprotease [Dyella nitratireducens]GGA25006.1 heat-shock protein [Dyella nitratireducens]GLQ43750.1 heat-shock protein [Dyella nitratireducens]
MHPRFLRSLTALFAAASLAVFPLHAHAILPSAVNGQPLPSLAPMLEKVTPAVVNISSKTRVRVRNPFFDDPVFRQFFGLQGTPREQVEQSLGSGVIVDAAKGYILTNNHVVGGADDITVTLQDGRNFKGTLVGTDPATDVAVVKINADKLQALPISDSSSLRVGDFVVAVGEPFGLGQTVTSGIVSALGRSGLGGSSFQNFIQTDASINPGNSGGPLVNLRGELVGINTMILSPSGGNVGIGFAIPSNVATEVMQQLIEHGKVSRGSLGAQTQDITPNIARVLNLKSNEGAVVTRVLPGSAAERAGLQEGDVITAVNGQALHDSGDLTNAIGLLPANSTVNLSTLRSGATRKVTAQLTPQKIATLDGAKLDPRLTGVTFSDLSDEQASQGMTGVVAAAVNPNSRAAQAGLSSGDVIVGVGNRRITSLRDLQGLAAARPRQLVLLVATDEGLNYVVVQ